MPRNIFAHTAPGADQPEFVSVNEGEEGGVEIILRSPKKLGGHTAQVSLTHHQTRLLQHALLKHLTPTGAA